MNAEEATAPQAEEKGQSAIDFLVTYGWALLIISVVLGLLYTYTSLPASIIPGTCTFYSSVSCTDILLNSNALILYLINSQPFPITSPALYAVISSQNSVTTNCIPNLVLPGGSLTCVINSLPVSTPLGALGSGSLYLSAAYCGLANNYMATMNCVTAPTLTYSGSFTAHSEPLPSTIPYASNYVIYLTAKNTTQSHGSARDPIYAQVMLGIYPVVGETVSFALSNSAFSSQVPAAITNTTGNAIGYVWGGTGSATLVVTASIGSAGSSPSNTLAITFT